MKQCTVSGCFSKFVARGYCSEHYSRWKAHGDPLIEKYGGRGGDRAVRVFWSHVDKLDSGECWPWTGCVERGYGKASWYNSDGKRVRLAHRIAYELFYGKHPGKLCVCHKCDNPICCNPHHLFLGTQGDNQKDRKAKGRSCFGERNGHSVLSEADVKTVREMRKQGMTNPQIAAVYGVCYSTISHACTGRSWGHVK